MKTFDLVIYHANCPDGLTGKWAFYRRFGAIDTVPCSYGMDPPNVVGKTVAIVDFSFSREIIQRLANDANYLVVLDHHKSAERELQDLNLCEKGEIVFDMERSGAQIAWDYLFNEPRPWIVDYVADRDLWRNVLPGTKEVSQALWFDGYYSSVEKLDSTIDAKPEDFVQRGAALLEYKNSEVQNYADHARPTEMVANGEVYRVHLAGCPRQYRSDVGNIIAETQNCDFAAVYWYDYWSNNWYVSMRASQHSRIDLSIVGHGHPKASALTIYGDQGQTLRDYFKPIYENSHK